MATCGARAWHGELCNLHALERIRSAPRPTAQKRLELGRRLLRDRARELGIVLEAEPVMEHVAVGAGRARKVRSPVA
jgi:hypothetical protein